MAISQRSWTKCVMIHSHCFAISGIHSESRVTTFLVLNVLLS